MKMIYEKITELIRTYPRLAVATIIESGGSTPREAGTKMIVCPDGKIVNTIGGGPFEKKVIEDALETIRDGKIQLKKYSFNPKGKDAQTGICGGDVTVLIEPVTGDIPLIVVGAGHVGRAVVKAAMMLPFDITVVDDRPGCLDYFKDYSNVHTVLTPPDYSGIPEPTADSYVCIVSYDHRFDALALKRVIRSQAKYIGLMGSAKKVKTLFEEFRREGYPDELLQRVHAPIGVPIESETPEEIAISILAEIIRIKNTGQ